MKGGVLLVFTAPSHGPCFSLPCLTQHWAPKSARASHRHPREAYRMSSVPCLRQGPRTPRVPSSVCSRQMPLKRSQCNNVLMREEACVFRFPHKSQRPRGQRPRICYLQSLRGRGGSRVETARFGGRDSRNSRKNGRLEKQKVPRCGQGQALPAGAVGQLVLRILLATVPGLGAGDAP